MMTSEPIVRALLRVEGGSLAGAWVPSSAIRGAVIIARAGGRPHHGPPDRHAARALREAGFGTLLLDLLTDAEVGEPAARLDLERLTLRLLAATLWVEARPDMCGLPIGCFGAGPVVAAALLSAVFSPRIGAVVSWSGRPDLAAGVLPQVHCPTLLIVDGDDVSGLRLNRRAAEVLGGPHAIALVPGSGAIVASPGTCAEVTRLATCWFQRHLRPRAPATGAAAGAR